MSDNSDKLKDIYWRYMDTATNCRDMWQEMYDAAVEDYLSKIRGMQSAYDRNSALSAEILEDIREELEESKGIVTQEISELYKKRDKVLKEMAKLSQKINKAKKELF